MTRSNVAKKLSKQPWITLGALIYSLTTLVFFVTLASSKWSKKIGSSSWRPTSKAHTHAPKQFGRSWGNKDTGGSLIQHQQQGYMAASGKSITQLQSLEFMDCQWHWPEKASNAISLSIRLLLLQHLECLRQSCPKICLTTWTHFWLHQL